MATSWLLRVSRPNYALRPASYPAFITSALGAAYRVYQTIDAERAFSDPAVTGGMFQARWLFGYWATWVGLLVPAILAQIRQREVSAPTAIESAESMPLNRFR